MEGYGGDARGSGEVGGESRRWSLGTGEAGLGLILGRGLGSGAAALAGSKCGRDELDLGLCFFYEKKNLEICSGAKLRKNAA